MKRGGWKRVLAWGIGIVLVLGLILAATWRRWVPSAAKVLLAARGVQIKTIAWEGTNSVKLEDVRITRPGMDIEITTLTSLAPGPWKAALRTQSTNEPPVFLTVNGWKVTLKPAPNSASAVQKKSIASQVKDFQAQLENLQRQCPRAVFLNGTLQHSVGEFRSGAMEWRDGALAGDFTWPGLNDPAELKLSKTNLMVRQIALEIGSRIAIQRAGENVRLSGYARWATNRADFDLTFSEASNLPAQGSIQSKGLSLPGNLIGIPEIERLNAAFSATITNGQVSLAIGEID